ncbi:hypothetical protein FJTKL_07547 [Diaporthe vaccinii]|uniref:Dihydrodipicolinate synthase n=1 Tax=Diaporthe vaccinii TaxID=105482 RepID=A0ABR4EU52_9PEZI
MTSPSIFRAQRPTSERAGLPPREADCWLRRTQCPRDAVLSRRGKGSRRRLCVGASSGILGCCHDAGRGRGLLQCGVTSGIDISSDSVIRLAKKHPGKIVGVKLTCGNVGKLQRVASALPKDGFSPFAGKSDSFLPALVAGSNGVIAALANVAPKTHVRLLKLYQDGDLKAAIELQSKLSNADGALSKVGVAGVKAVFSHFFSYGSGRGRRPLGLTTVSAFSDDIIGPIKEVVDLER